MEDTSRLVSALEVRVRKLEHWSAAHDGRINVLWQDQIEINKKMDLNMTELELRTRYVERRFHMVTGFVACFGALAGCVPVLVVVYFNLV